MTQKRRGPLQSRVEVRAELSFLPIRIHCYAVNIFIFINYGSSISFDGIKKFHPDGTLGNTRSSLNNNQITMLHSGTNICSKIKSGATKSGDAKQSLKISRSLERFPIGIRKTISRARNVFDLCLYDAF